MSNFDKSFDGLDLRAVTFVTGATAVVSGTTLVVTDGGNKYDFQLGGTLGASYSVTSDGAGGTLINDPPRNEAAFAQAFTLLTNPLAPNFVGSNGVYGASRAKRGADRLGHGARPARLDGRFEAKT